MTYEPGQTSPYRLHQGAWIQRLDAQIEGYRSQAVGLLGLSEEARRTEIERRVNALQAEIETTQRRINELTDRAQQKAQREAFKEELKNRPELKELVAFAFHSRLTDHAYADPLRSGDADNVLETLRDIQNQYRETFRLPEFARISGIPAILRDMAWEMAPNAQRLAADPALFEVIPGRGQETTTFYAVHRPLYAAFRGVPLEECVGGACNYLQHTTGKRHAVPVLDGVEVRFAEVEGRWTGFTEVVPVRSSETGRVYGSALLGHTRFKTPVYVTDNTGHKTRTTLYELWLERVPKPEGGLVIGRADSGDNARVLSSIRGTHSYLLGENVGPATHFTHVEANRELVERINRHSPQDRFGYDRRNQLIFDATLPGAGRLTVLNPIRAAEVKEKIRDYLTGTDFKMKKRVLDYLIQNPDARSRYAGETRALLASPDPTLTARAELLHPGAEPDPARLLQAHITIVDDPATHNELGTRLAQKVGEMTREDPGLRTVLERNLQVTQPRAVTAVAQAYLRAGGTSPDAAALMFTYLSVAEHPDYHGATAFLRNLESIPPALAERVLDHLKRLPPASRNRRGSPAKRSLRLRAELPHVGTP